MGITKEDLRIVFMGTPDFAVDSLKALVEGGYNIVGVITMPDKPVGRHQDKLSQSAVKKYALAHHLPLLQPCNLKEESFISELKNMRADLQIVVAFRMLPEIVWNMPKYGTFNLHASLLPKYRGAAPINWAIINGEKETGVTTFFLNHDIDTGSIIFQEKVEINKDDNAEIIHDKLMQKGAQLVLRTVDSILSDSITPIPQHQLSVSATPAPKIFKETCRIDWDKNINYIYNFIRGLSPYPAAWTMIKNGAKKAQQLKIFESEVLLDNPKEGVGTVIIENNTIKIAMLDGYLSIKSLQLEGRKRMSVIDFLRGFRPEENIIVE